MFLKTKMYPFQQRGYEKLVKLTVGALFQDMGTGKTRVALELVKHRLDADKIDCCLWLTPVSVIKSLESEINKHSVDTTDVIIVRGIESFSSSVKTYFEMLHLCESKRVMLIVDESSLCKNITALRTQNIMKLADACKYKLILNGTPITKSEVDLFSQMYLLDWKILGYKSYYSFCSHHVHFDNMGVIKDTYDIAPLIEKIKPFAYRIKKEDVMEITPTRYTDYSYQLSVDDQDVYMQMAYELSLTIETLQGKQRIIAIYKMLNNLQNYICGIDRYKPYDINPRLKTLIKAVTDIPKDEKCVIYTRYVKEVDNICRFLTDKGFSVIGMNGSMKRAERADKLKIFEESTQFLVSTKTIASFGLNLQFANNIIYYSNDWNYGTRVQSENRMQRIGQTKTVTIADVYCENTLDDYIFRSIKCKEKLSKTFLEEILEAIKKEIKENKKNY